MNSIQMVLLILAGSAVAAFGIFYGIQKWKARRQTSAHHRLPQRVDAVGRLFPVNTGSIEGGQVLARSVARKPCAVDEYEYLTFRNCPKCHSENTRTSHVIRKIGDHEFVCHACGNRFQF